MSGQSSRVQLIRQRVVNRAKPHYECCYGKGGDDPQSWLVVARFFAESKWALAFELADDASNNVRNHSIRLLQHLFDVDRNDGAAVQILPSGEQLVALDATLAKICHSYSNWYGDWHYRRGALIAAAPPAVKAAPEPTTQKDFDPVSENSGCRVYLMSAYRRDS